MFGFRGNKEHTEYQITEGTYPSDHPSFVNQRYRGVKDFKDKTHKLGTNNTYVRSEMDMGRFPVLTGEAAGTAQDIGGAIDRFIKTIPKGHGKGRLYLRISRDGKSFVNQPLGKNSVRKIFQQAFQCLGISNWELLRPHALRGHFITKLAND